MSVLLLTFSILVFVKRHEHVGGLGTVHIVDMYLRLAYSWIPTRVSCRDFRSCFIITIISSARCQHFNGHLNSVVTNLRWPLQRNLCIMWCLSAIEATFSFWGYKSDKIFNSSPSWGYYTHSSHFTGRLMTSYMNNGSTVPCNYRLC